MTADEIMRLLSASAPHRRLLLETAFCTGLRANELRSWMISTWNAEFCTSMQTGQKTGKPGYNPCRSRWHNV